MAIMLVLSLISLIAFCIKGNKKIDSHLESIISFMVQNLKNKEKPTLKDKKCINSKSKINKDKNKEKKIIIKKIIKTKKIIKILKIMKEIILHLKINL